MRVLILGPVHAGGSLPPYLDALAAGLEHHGVTTVRAGSSQIPYDHARQEFWPASRVAAAARALARETDPGALDLVALNAGNLEYDQLVPAIWAQDHRAAPPLVQHVHTLAPTLLRDHTPAPGWDRAARDAARRASGRVYFGQYARRQFPGWPGGVAWLPTTIPDGTLPVARPTLAEALDTPLPVDQPLRVRRPVEGRRASALRHQAHARSGPGHPGRGLLGRPAQADVDLRAFTSGPVRAGYGELTVVRGYLGPADRAALVRASTAGVFPYRPHPSFQGSGAIADYLAHAVPVIATSVANMAELTGSAGTTVPPGDPQALAAALDVAVADGDAAAALARHAQARAVLFTPQTHAARCLGIYQQALGGNRRLTT